MGARLFAWLQYLLPQHAISRLVGWLGRLEVPWARTALVRGFMAMFRIDMSEAAEPDPLAYASFNAFFTRALQPEARPMPTAAEALACPVDGRVSQCTDVEDGQLFQAKGFRYDLERLLGGPAPEALWDGSFATLYLAPYDYHRIHAPADGRLVEMRYLPGALFSVNGATVSAVPRLFARNERVACLFETDFGPMAVVLVGALNVGSIETTWAGEVAPGPDRQAAFWRYPQEGPGSVRLARGEELGRFNFGSTVIVILPQGGPRFAPAISAGRRVRLGETLAS
ncbi:archaetidylserine decarboxylase [Thioalkalivibrio sp. XN279]|uniref:archaetidylserine decarboxylase n=1 Tax=Thioalkalivibrio sp. XN279 TaxID=2714953 RepID=UPI0014077E81|nr:archaetidylserine decarboxylase [Thioalkalivibrio sp. XN279]NHA15532.1 phosphatidylserine decarboxylase [Thioalkalivibrio sp. XN279]